MMQRKIVPPPNSQANGRVPATDGTNRRHRRKIILRSLCVALLFGGLIAWISAQSEPLLSLQVIRVQAAEDAERVTVELERRALRAFQLEGCQLHARISGKWVPLKQNVIESDDLETLLSRTNRQSFELRLPAHTQACRFSFDYRSGARPYCEAYFFLEKHGVMRRFPSASRKILRLFPQKQKLRHHECVLEIPASVEADKPAGRRPVVLSARAGG